MSEHYFFPFSRYLCCGIAVLVSSSIYCQPNSNNPPRQNYSQEDIARWRQRQVQSQSNWDYKESWRYDKDAFYRGETQPEAIETEYYHIRPPGVGDRYDDYYKYYYQYYHRPFYDTSNPNNGAVHDNYNPAGRENENQNYPRKFPSYGR